MSSTEAKIQPTLPEELYVHLRDMDPRSYSFQQDFNALNELALETGHSALTLDAILPVAIETPPNGYKSSEVIPMGTSIPTAQFEGSIHSLVVKETNLVTDVKRLVTDSGRTIRYCDLREFMTSSVKKGGPETEKAREALDRVVMRDLKFFAETGHSKLKVTGIKGVMYSRLGDTKIRAYWMPVQDRFAEEGAITVARIADSGDSIAAESDLYRRVFQMKL